MEENKKEQAQERLLQEGAALGSLSLPLLMEIFDSFKEAVIVTDTDRRIVYTNSATESLFGYTREELYGQKPKFFMPIKQTFLIREKNALIRQAQRPQRIIG